MKTCENKLVSHSRQLYICSLCMFILPPFCGCYSSSVSLTMQKNPNSWNIFDNAGRVLSKTAVNGPETSRPGVLGPQITKFWWEHSCIFQDFYGCLFVRGILPVSIPVQVNFLSLSFCIWSVWPVNHWLFMYWMIVKSEMLFDKIIHQLFVT